MPGPIPARPELSLRLPHSRAKHKPRPILSENSVNVSKELVLAELLTPLGNVDPTTDPLEWGCRVHTQMGVNVREYRGLSR